MLEVGSHVAGYRIEGLLGRGGMGAVYEAKQLSLNRTVALKVLSSDLGLDEAFRARFRREGEVQALLDHPHIVAIYEAGELEDGLFIVMRIVRGPNLKELIRSRELDPPRTLALLRPVADALDAAHSAGLIHRDVKPQNILIGPRDHPYLADFGLTRAEEDLSLTRTGEFVGTIQYIAPEQILGEPARAPSDIYALTGVLCECLTGSVPYPRPSEVAVLYSHVHDPPPKATALRPDLPQAIDAVIAAGMAKAPQDRPTSAVELLEAAAAALSGSRARGIVPPIHGTTRLTRPARPASLETQVPVDTPSTGRMPSSADALSTGRMPSTADERPVRARTGVTQREVSSGRARRRAPMVLGAVVLAAIAAGAFLIGRAGDTAPRAGPLIIDAGNRKLALRAPAGWRRQRGREAPEVPGLRMGDRLALVPSSPPASGTVAGLTEATGATLLPTGLRERVVGKLPEADRVQLGPQQALRYRDVRVRGFDRSLTLFTAPTTLGVATVACYAPSAVLAGFAGDCERLAQSLRLRRGRSYPLGPNPATARAFDGILDDLNGVRRSGRLRLGSAKAPEGQSRVAAALARSHGAAAARVADLEVSPAIVGSTAAIAAALRSGRDAYLQLAKAANRGQDDDFRAASTRVGAAERAVDMAVGRLGRAGYRVAGS